MGRLGGKGILGWDNRNKGIKVRISMVCEDYKVVVMLGAMIDEVGLDFRGFCMLGLGDIMGRLCMTKLNGNIRL